jgi:hypothetical protein
LVDGEVAGKIYSQRPISHFRVFQRKKLVLQLLHLLLLLLPVPEALVIHCRTKKFLCRYIYSDQRNDDRSENSKGIMGRVI